MERKVLKYSWLMFLCIGVTPTVADDCPEFTGKYACQPVQSLFNGKTMPITKAMQFRITYQWLDDDRTVFKSTTTNSLGDTTSSQTHLTGTEVIELDQTSPGVLGHQYRAWCENGVLNYWQTWVQGGDNPFQGTALSKIQMVGSSVQLESWSESTSEYGGKSYMKTVCYRK